MKLTPYLTAVVSVSCAFGAFAADDSKALLEDALSAAPPPNDRRHTFKFFGSWEPVENLTVGWNATLQSGRPKSLFGHTQSHRKRIWR